MDPATAVASSSVVQREPVEQTAATEAQVQPPRESLHEPIRELTPEETQSAKAEANERREMFAKGAAPGGVALLPPVLAPKLPAVTSAEYRRIDQIKRLFMTAVFMQPALKTDLELVAKNPEAFEKKQKEVELFEKEHAPAEVALLNYYATYMLSFLGKLIEERYGSAEIRATSKEQRVIVLKTQLSSKVAANVDEIGKVSPEMVASITKRYQDNLLAATVLVDQMFETMPGLSLALVRDYRKELLKGNYLSTDTNLLPLSNFFAALPEVKRGEFITEVAERLKGCFQQVIDTVYAKCVELTLINPEFKTGILAQLAKLTGLDTVKANIEIGEKAFTEAERAVYRFLVEYGTSMAKQKGLQAPDEVIAFAFKRVFTMAGNNVVKEAAQTIAKIDSEYVDDLILVQSKAENCAAVSKMAAFVGKLESADSAILEKVKKMLEDAPEKRDQAILPYAAELFTFVDSLAGTLRASILKGFIDGIDKTISQRADKR